LIRFGQIWLDLGDVWANFSKILGKIWRKIYATYAAATPRKIDEIWANLVRFGGYLGKFEQN